MYCLKNAKCSCGGKYILVTENGIVSHATCEKCFKIYILPQDNAKTFILENCEKYTKKNSFPFYLPKHLLSIKMSLCYTLMEGNSL